MFELRKKKKYICQLGIDVGKRLSPEGGENLLPREPCKLLVIVLHRVRRCIIYNYASFFYNEYRWINPIISRFGWLINGEIGDILKIEGGIDMVSLEGISWMNYSSVNDR